jgi:hypothetical protein
MEDINYHTCLVIYIVGVLKFTPQSRRIVTVYSIAGSCDEWNFLPKYPNMLIIYLICNTQNMLIYTSEATVNHFSRALIHQRKHAVVPFVEMPFTGCH